ncbi:MAG: TolC family protein, partial [Rubrivivax sp.]|nr:TolC family protein [Rubrivivax sp.]
MRWLASSMACWALAGCASLQQAGPARAPLPPPPPAWTGVSAAAPAADAAALALWWRRFDHPVLPPLVEQALAGSTDIAAARARLRQARAQHDLAAAGR